MPYLMSEQECLADIASRVTEPIAMTGANGIDTPGPRFDGVKHLSRKEPGMVDVSAAKSKKIAIAGADTSGLMTYPVLHQEALQKRPCSRQATVSVVGLIQPTYLAGRSTILSRKGRR